MYLFYNNRNLEDFLRKVYGFKCNLKIVKEKIYCDNEEIFNDVVTISGSLGVADFIDSTGMDVVPLIEKEDSFSLSIYNIINLLEDKVYVRVDDVKAVIKGDYKIIDGSLAIEVYYKSV